MLLSSRHLCRSAATLYLQSAKLSADVSPDNNNSLIPEEARKKVFNRVPNNDKQKRHYMNFRKQINRFANEGNTEQLQLLLKKYIAENPNTHYISSQNIRQLSTPFSKKGDIDKSKELLNLFEHLSKFKKGHRQTDDLKSRVNSNYLFSLMSCKDKDRAVKEMKVYLDEKKSVMTRQHPQLLEAASKVLRTLDMFTELEDLVTSLQSSKIPVPPSAMLDLTAHFLQVGKEDKALETLLSASGSVNLIPMNDDHFAQLAYLCTQLLPTPAYKEIGGFLCQSLASLKNFIHFSVPVTKHSTICKNYEIVLSVAAKRDNSRLFRIIGGRNGLFRNLEHVSCAEYVDMIRYIVEVCKYYNISIDAKFWHHLFYGLFKVGGYKNMDYTHVQEVRKVLNMHPTTEEIWTRIIQCVPRNQAILVYKDLMKMGIMSDDIYTELFLRSDPSPSDPLYMKLQSLRSHYTVNITNPLTNKR